MEQKLQYINVELIDPHPDNPRKDLGDLSELADSIRGNGVMQNLTIVKQIDSETNEWNGRYTAVIGHRRLAASKLAGVEAVPCVISDMDHKQQVSTMLLENMQRSDLTPYEEAHGFQMMLDLGESVASVSERTGFSETKVRRRVEWTKLDQKLLKEVSQERQISITDLDKLAQIEDVSERNAALEKIGTRDYEWEVNRRVRAQKIAKNKPLIMKKIEELGYAVLPPEHRYSQQYERIGNDISLESWTEDTEFPSIAGKQKIYYDMPSYSSSVQFYVKKKKAAPIKKSQEEIDREKNIKQAWTTATELAAMAHSLRLEFVKNLKLNKTNTDRMLKAAIKCLVIHTLSYFDHHRDFGKKIFGIDEASYDSSKNVQEAFRKLETSDSSKLIPLTILNALGESPEMSYFTDYKKAYPAYKENRQLDVIYEWICSLGYEMSTDEQQLKNGTHPLFKRDES